MAAFEIVGEDEAGRTGLFSFEAYSPLKYAQWGLLIARDARHTRLCLGPFHRNTTLMDLHQCLNFEVSINDARQMARALLDTLADTPLQDRFRSIGK